MWDALVGSLEDDAGHGTFIAGLIRQACPDARILAVRVFGGDGVVGEGSLLRTLQLLALRQALAVHGDTSIQPVDVVSLSLGYYHEQPGDAAFDALMLGPIKMLGRLGATVVVSAGNDATVRPMYPAAFTPHDKGPVPAARDALPVIAVGATNPNKSVALFSNDGPWVRALRPGAALVSSYPRTFDASLQPLAELVTTAGEWRSTLDPDDYLAGFAVWSGTSFAAPVLAGQIAAQLLALYAEGDRAVDAHAAADRGWAAIAAATAEDPDRLVRP
jgi:subtilisin family serine protease